MQVLIADQLAIRCLGSGWLLPWMGPAVRGLVARPWKEAVCRLSEAEQTQHESCSFGCPHHAVCDYGRTVEPHKVGRPNERGSTNIVFATGFPIIAESVAGRTATVESRPLPAVKGTTFPLTLTLTGPGVDSLDTVLNRLTKELPTRGFGDEKSPVLCELVRSGLRVETHDLCSGHLLLPTAENKATVRRLRVELTSPLILKQSFQQGRLLPKSRLNLRPHLGDLLSKCLSLIESLFQQAGEFFEFDRDQLKRLADGKPPLQESFRPFEQAKKCNRSIQNCLAEGIVGHAVYADVPQVLIPWLSWGGRLHVGDHRVAGAGGWRLIVE